MPRVGADIRPVVSRPPARATRARAKKPAPPQDRLSARRLFLRRLRRSLKPGLWILGCGTVLILVTETIRSWPTDISAANVKTEQKFGLAGLAADAGLRIDKIEISGADATDMAALRQAIGVTPGTPTLGFSLAAIRDRVEQLGPVQSATVERILPGTLVVSIVERNAFAIWQTGSGDQTKFELIDASGNVIADQNAAAAKHRQPDLILLSGADAPRHAQSLITELKAAPSVFSHVAAAARVDGLRWNLILKDQTLVKLPQAGEADAIAELARLQSSMQLLDRPVEVIDLRLPGRLVVRPYPAPDGKDDKDKAKPAKETHE